VAQYDAIVIGGGPGGSTVATALSRKGRSVLVLEKTRFPRFHVGESLLPYSLEIFDRLGVHEKIRAAGYQEKWGAYFWNGETGGTRAVVFGNASNDRHPMAYQVKRADFDKLLLDHSASCGAEVREETKVEEVLFEEGRAVGVRVANGTGRAEEIRSRVVVDASGQDALLSRRLGIREFDRNLKRAALFAHYENVPRPEGRAAGDILLPVENGVWYWLIPFSDGTTSVGGVFEPELLREGAPADSEARLEWLLDRSPQARRLLGGGRRISKVYGISDYSAVSKKLGGDGWVLVGDAATFLDPVFSTGVFLAMATGERAAAAIDDALARRGIVRARDFRRYTRQSRAMFRRFRRFVYGFYDPVFFKLFCEEPPLDAMRAYVTTVLAGGVERFGWRERLWTSSIFWGTAMEKRRLKKAMAARPEARPALGSD
jgi:flavin-dependent dehydrogenase